MSVNDELRYAVRLMATGFHAAPLGNAVAEICRTIVPNCLLPSVPDTVGDNCSTLKMFKNTYLKSATALPAGALIVNHLFSRGDVLRLIAAALAPG